MYSEIRELEFEIVSHSTNFMNFCEPASHRIIGVAAGIDSILTLKLVAKKYLKIRRTKHGARRDEESANLSHRVPIIQ